MAFTVCFSFAVEETEAWKHEGWDLSVQIETQWCRCTYLGWMFGLPSLDDGEKWASPECHWLV